MISFLRFIAMLLITNSHFGGLYPEGLSGLATGGTIGNALFMFCSGYTLYFSLMKLKKTEVLKPKIRMFSDWYLKRILRIFPSVWIFRVFQILALGVSFQWSMLYLPGYWFLNAIIVFYMLFYIVIKNFNTRLPSVFVILFICFLILFFIQPNYSTEFIIEKTGHPYKIHWFYYFAIMLFGAYIAKNKELYFEKHKFGWFKLLLFVGAYYCVKGLLIHFELFSFQFIVPFLLFPVMKYFVAVSNDITNLKNYKRFEKSIVFLSNITLDVYISQFFIISYMNKMQFPVGFILAWLLIFICGLLLYLSSKKLNQFIVKKLNI